MATAQLRIMVTRVIDPFNFWAHIGTGGYNQGTQYLSCLVRCQQVLVLVQLLKVHCGGFVCI